MDGIGIKDLAELLEDLVWFDKHEGYIQVVSIDNLHMAKKVHGPRRAQEIIDSTEEYLLSNGYYVYGIKEGLYIAYSEEPWHSNQYCTIQSIFKEKGAAFELIREVQSIIKEKRNEN